MKTDLPAPMKGKSRSPHPARALAKARSASGERWQEHARHAARGSRSAELDPARLLQARRLHPAGHFIRKAALARALRDAAWN